jgi:hypothetical protein
MALKLQFAQLIKLFTQAVQRSLARAHYVQFQVSVQADFHLAFCKKDM